MPPDDQAVSNKDLWIELRKLHDQVTLMVPQGVVIQDHEQRLRSLERWKYALPTSLFMAGASLVAVFLQIKGV